jgi:regulator of chromosome condensation
VDPEPEVRTVCRSKTTRAATTATTAKHTKATNGPRSRARAPAAAATADDKGPALKPESKTKTKTQAPRPYFNPLPKAREHVRPVTQAFAGNFGQFGMCADRLGPYDKLTMNKWVKERTEDGTFGGESVGIESVAAGGLHTIFIDEKGTVCFSPVQG